MPDYLRLLRRPVMRVFGKVVTYLSPDEMIDLQGLVGTTNRVPIMLSSGADDTGGIPQMRTVLRLRAQDFPDETGPEQGALVTVDGERSQVSDVLADPAGWYDLVLVGVDG
jgi:hypothetical protein